MRINLPVSITLGIITEIAYTLLIMLAAFVICLALTWTL
jgi:hypothetical protein